jgi:hypothetical protein
LKILNNPGIFLYLPLTIRRTVSKGFIIILPFSLCFKTECFPVPSLAFLLFSFNCFHSDAFIQLLSVCCFHSAAFIQLLSFSCFHSAAFILVISFCCVHSAAFIQLLSFSCFHSAAFIQLLSFSCFYSAAFIQLQHSTRFIFLVSLRMTHLFASQEILYQIEQRSEGGNDRKCLLGGI